MIRVDITMWPHGDETRAYSLGRIEISNDGTGTEKLGHYDVAVFSKAGACIRECRVENFQRARETATTLLARALIAAGYGK